MKKNIIFFSYLLLHAETSTNELTITLRLFPPSYTLFINNNVVKPAPLSEYVNTVVLTPGTYSFLVKSPGYINKQLNITLKENIQIEEKLEKDDSLLELIQEIKTGKQPKSVEFTPDGKYLVTALLADNGIDIFSTNNFTKVKRIKPPEPYPAKTAFVEIAFSSRLNEMWVSQMSTASVHIFDLDNFSYKATISTKGKGPKVIIFGSEEKYAYVSNWFSNTIAVIDTDTRSVKPIFYSCTAKSDHLNL
jgi:DNA-binding beta-propeller fold protein YncE